MEHHVHVTCPRGCKGGLEALEEVVPAARARDTRPRGEVVTEVRVGEEKEAHGVVPCSEYEQVYSIGRTLGADRRAPFSAHGGTRRPVAAGRQHTLGAIVSSGRDAAPPTHEIHTAGELP